MSKDILPLKHINQFMAFSISSLHGNHKSNIKDFLTWPKTQSFT